jgi:predicted hydrolase (HD superfamily)
MIPTPEEAMALWNTYNLPEKKRIHVSLVAKVSLFLATRCQEKISDYQIHTTLLHAAALLHDIDKSIPKASGEQHPDTAVRILRLENMEEVAAVVKTHSLYAILDPSIAPKSWEEKILYLADKMVKQEIITVDRRFALWREEDLPSEAITKLEQCYPHVKVLEKEIFSLIDMNPKDVAKFA